VTFLERIFENLRRAASQPVLQEARAEGIVSVTGAELLALTADARAFFARQVSRVEIAARSSRRTAFAGWRSISR
jgi:hypothetical protein